MADVETTALAPAILTHLQSGAYPSSPSLSAADLTSDTLPNIISSLRNEQESLKTSIRQLSRNAAPDIDTWISRARDLQADILRSRETAREIVAEAERVRELRGEAEEKGRKIKLLEAEVGFSERLGEGLRGFGEVNQGVGVVRQHVLAGRLTEAVGGLETVETGVEDLGGSGFEGTRAFGVLQERVRGAREDLTERVNENWGQLVVARASEGDRTRLTMRKHLGNQKDITLESVLDAAERLGLAEQYAKKLTTNIDRTMLRSLLSKGRDGKSGKITGSSTTPDALECTPDSQVNDTASILGSVKALLSHLHSRLPHQSGIQYSATFMPVLISRLEEHWLEPSVPLDMSRIDEFEITLTELLSFADFIGSLQWYGVDQLRQWVDGAPRAWLTKRRETLLGDVRNLVFSGSQDKKTVERVETEMVGRGGALAISGNGGDNDWDSAWEEPSEASHERSAAASASAAAPNRTPIDDDEASAWDTDDIDDHSEKPDETGEEAWGWGDGDDANKPASPIATRTAPVQTNGIAPAQPQQREVTLRESYTTTAVPATLLSQIQVVIKGAQTLFGPEYAESPIAPAAQGLYTLPTLALAIYRATAPTAYAKIPVGNMLIYNDATCLSASLLAWQANTPPSSRLRLEADTNALDTFAKRAYTAELDAQRTILRDLLDGAQGFADCTVQPNKAECESAVQQVVDHMHEVYALWKPVLAPSALLQSLGSLLSSIIGKIVLEVEELADIAESDSKQLRLLCDKISSLKSLFVTNEGATDMTFIYCPPWLKFQYLGEILESSLADIRYMWSEGELSLEFEGEEVVELIEALFAESDLRRRAVGEIRRGR
ncbi:ribosome biogenesis protein ytm1 [Oleoguttula sp. CCFEE 5521]